MSSRQLKDTCTDDSSQDSHLCLQIVRTWELTDHMMYIICTCVPVLLYSWQWLLLCILLLYSHCCCCCCVTWGVEGGSESRDSRWQSGLTSLSISDLQQQGNIGVVTMKIPPALITTLVTSSVISQAKVKSQRLKASLDWRGLPSLNFGLWLLAFLLQSFPWK